MIAVAERTKPSICASFSIRTRRTSPPNASSNVLDRLRSLWRVFPEWCTSFAPVAGSRRRVRQRPRRTGTTPLPAAATSPKRCARGWSSGRLWIARWSTARDATSARSVATTPSSAAGVASHRSPVSATRSVVSFGVGSFRYPILWTSGACSSVATTTANASPARIARTHGTPWRPATPRRKPAGSLKRDAIPIRRRSASHSPSSAPARARISASSPATSSSSGPPARRAASAKRSSVARAAAGASATTRGAELAAGGASGVTVLRSVPGSEREGESQQDRELVRAAAEGLVVRVAPLGEGGGVPVEPVAAAGLHSEQDRVVAVVSRFEARVAQVGAAVDRQLRIHAEVEVVVGGQEEGDRVGARRREVRDLELGADLVLIGEEVAGAEQ